jgi:hypothetical protein
VRRAADEFTGRGIVDVDSQRFSSFDFVGLKDADCLGQLTGAAELAAPASAAELTGAHPP